MVSGVGPAGQEDVEDDRGGGPGPPWTTFGFLRLSFVPLFFWCEKSDTLSFVSVLFFSLSSEVLGSPTMTGWAGLGLDTDIYRKVYRCCQGLSARMLQDKKQDYTLTNIFVTRNHSTFLICFSPPKIQ